MVLDKGEDVSDLGPPLGCGEDSQRYQCRICSRLLDVHVDAARILGGWVGRCRVRRYPLLAIALFSGWLVGFTTLDDEVVIIIQSIIAAERQRRVIVGGLAVRRNAHMTEEWWLIVAKNMGWRRKECRRRSGMWHLKPIAIGWELLFALHPFCNI